MQNDQRLTPLPVVTHDLQTSPVEFSAAYPSSYEDSLNSKRSIRQYINIVYKRLPIILAITILVTAAVAFYSYRLPPEYLASTSMIIEPRKPPQTSKEPTIINNFGDDPKYLNTQLQLLKSPDLMRKAVIALGLHRDATVFGDQGREILGGLRSLFNRGQKPEETDNALPIVSGSADDKSGGTNLTPEESSRADSYAGILVGGLDVVQKSQTNIVDITLKSSNPVVAAKAVDKIAEIFKDDDADRETNGAQTALKNLRKSIDDLDATIHQEEDAYIQTMTRSDLPLGEKGSDVRAADLQSLTGRWREAQKAVGDAQAEYSAALEADKNGNILAVAGDIKAVQDARSQQIKRQQDLDKLIQDFDKKIDEKTQKKEELLVKYQPEYKEVKAVVAEIAELEKQKNRVTKENTKKIEDEGKAIEANARKEVLASRKATLTAAEQKEAKLRASLGQTEAKANIDGQAETTIIGQQRQLTSNRTLLDSLRQREKEQDLALATDAPKNIKIQNNAVVPTTPIGPARGRNILVALFLSLGAGIGLAFLLDFLDDSVRTSDDITRHLGLPTLALIPHYLNSDKKKLLAAANGNGNGIPATAALITMEERNSPMAEAYRHLRTSLLFSSAGKPPQTILVTSSQPSEGKTTTAINTAITLAQSDVEVVIIDCDLRRPRLHSHFGLENTSGLTNYLSGDKNTENLMKTYKDLPRLKVITSGPIPPNPAELLSSNEMRNLLTFLSGRFKHIIIDSPPAISFTDASILSTLVDGVVLVAMANKSSIHLMRQFKQRVTAIGARIYGVVLNGIKSNSEEYYYYGSGYYNYYSKGHDDSTPMMGEETEQKAER